MSKRASSENSRPRFADPTNEADWWSKCVTLDSVRKRINAKVVNFRRAVVREQDADGYWREVASIWIKNDQVECNHSDYTLTDDEKRSIVREVAAANFPKSITARKGSLPPQLKGADKKDFCVFYNQSGDEIEFIQWRKNGEKPDLPLSFWSDGKWRIMEPDGPLPLFGLERLKGAVEVWLHEGAKGARELQDLACAQDATHPWLEALRGAVHLGWPGGAPNVDRVDWSPIKKLPPHIRLVVVCDNDQVGKNAAQKISETLRRPMTAIMFDDRFPVSFDLADPWPEHADWWSNKRYTGPTVEDCLVPATWATDVLDEKRGRPSFTVRKEFAAEWLWVEEPSVFVHRNQTNRLRNEAAFNRIVRPFSNAQDTARLLVRHVSSQCNGVTYVPGQCGGVLNIGGQRLINCYCPSDIKAVKGDAKKFLEFMQHLIPEERDRNELLRWCATLIARPGIRMSYGVLLISERQGVGKGTLGETILTPLIGQRNVSFPNEHQVTESPFNSWIAHKRLAIVHEIYAGHSLKGYNKLKSVITDQLVEVNEKYMPAYTLENMIHIFACSNSTRALRLDDHDRRWLVPRVTEETKPPVYWRELHGWLREGGLSIIRAWADEFLSGNDPVRQGQHAPSSCWKNEIVAEGRSEGARFAFELGEIVNEKREKIVLVVEDVRAWVADQRQLSRNDPKMESSLTLRKALQAAGLKEPRRRLDAERQRFRVSAGCKSYIVANFDISADETWPALKDFYKKPDILWSL